MVLSFDLTIQTLDIHKSLVLGRTASVASNARALIELCGLGVDRKHK